MIQHCAGVVLAVAFSCCAPALGQHAVPTTAPYSLPPATLSALEELAGETDVLVLGEIHGTQEVSAVAAALLAPFAKRGYGLLALEIPSDQQRALTDWATGKSTTVPSFFARPFGDGRGSIETLSLIRTALAPPFRWRLICFDVSAGDALTDDAETDRQAKADDSPDESAAMIELSLRRDARMAANVAQERARLAPPAKVLAICGSFHARTRNPATAAAQPDEIAKLMGKLWPSFAAALQANNPTWRVRSVNIVPHSGEYFAMVATDDNPVPTKGQVHTIRAARQLDHAEVRKIENGPWDWQLDLPRSTAATFLAPPSNDPLPPTESPPAIKRSGSLHHNCRRGRVSCARRFSRRCR